MNSSPSLRRRTRGLPHKLVLALILLGASSFAAAGQDAPRPQREQLLNGLRILMLPRPGDQNVLVRVRVHSGAAFDLAGKEGLMAALADAMFDQQTRDYVTEELHGDIKVTTDYDALDITLRGKAGDLNRLIELARNAVMNVQLTPEVVERVRAARVKALREAQPTPAEVADRAVAARLFGKHPYGRPAEGSPESVARIERPDLMTMRERFLHPDNTTLVVVGGFEPKPLMRTLRESFGGWVKSDRAIPATFSQPAPPDERTLVINRPGSSEVEVRLAVRGLARADHDAAAGQVLPALILSRWLASVPELTGHGAVVRHETYQSGGIFVMGARLRSAAEAAKALEAARAILNTLSSAPPTASELQVAKGAAASSYTASSQGDAGAANSWLDEHTYNSPAATAPEMARAVAAVTPADIQRVAARLFRAPVASVAVGDAAQLRTELARVGSVEVFGEEAARPEARQPAPQTPQTKPQQPALQLKRP
jgi:zinc protease